MGFDARQAREAFEHLSQACMSCIFFDFHVILLSASLQECGDGAAAKEPLRDLRYDGLHVAIRGRCKFHARVAEPKLFVSAEGHLVTGAQVLLGHVVVGRK